MRKLTVLGLVLLVGTVGGLLYAQGRGHGGGARNRSENRAEKREKHQTQSQEQTRDQKGALSGPSAFVGSCGRTCATCDRDCPGCDKDCARCLKGCLGCDMDCGNCNRDCERAALRARDGKGAGCPKVPAAAPAGGTSSESDRGVTSDQPHPEAHPRGNGSCGSCPGCK